MVLSHTAGEGGISGLRADGWVKLWCFWSHKVDCSLSLPAGPGH